VRTRPTLVTGATGFLGRLLVRRLVDEGRRVRVLERTASDAFAGLPVERTRGDVTEPESLLRAMAGVEVVHHLAGLVSYERAHADRLNAVNVTGTRNVLEAAERAGVRRLVHVSSTAAVGMTFDPASPLDETSPFPDRARENPYALSKRLGEEAALAAATRGLDVVVACPGIALGAGDVNRVSTFMVEQYLRGALRVTMPGGINYVDARDVVESLTALEERGVRGRRYIVGTRDGNRSHRDFLRLVTEVSGVRRRTVHLPAAPLVPALRVLGRTPVPLPLTADEVANGRWYWFVRPDRAIDELGLRPRPLAEAVEDTVRWFRDRGLRPR
jgi:dihydroflavonol-4-reductase